MGGDLLSSLFTIDDGKVVPVYTNGMDFYGNQAEIGITFILRPPGAFSTSKVAQVIMTPLVAKAFGRFITEKVKEWENEHGTLYLPEDTKLVEDLFGASPAPKDPEGDDDTE